MQNPEEFSLKNIDGVSETITLGGGCFWCTEAIFEKLDGVVSVISGYSGGFIKNPSYREVCTGSTGHAEVVQIKFDPSVVSLNEILEVFFKTHDPTTVDRQGADTGSQYRSVIFYNSYEQKRIIENKIRNLESSGLFSKPIVTRVELFTTFYPAEEYHQDYFFKNPNAAYCRIVINPKIIKLEKDFNKMLK